MNVNMVINKHMRNISEKLVVRYVIRIRNVKEMYFLLELITEEVRPGKYMNIGVSAIMYICAIFDENQFGEVGPKSIVM